MLCDRNDVNANIDGEDRHCVVNKSHKHDLKDSAALLTAPYWLACIVCGCSTERMIFWGFFFSGPFEMGDNERSPGLLTLWYEENLH